MCWEDALPAGSKDDLFLIEWEGVDRRTASTSN